MSIKKQTQLLFVYNADSGVFNLLGDMAHKVFSPKTYSCNLCALTHSTFSMRDEWKAFLESLEVELAFLHRDEFKTTHPEREVGLPAIFLQSDEGLEMLADAEAINASQTMDDLKTLIRSGLEAHSIEPGS
ncbi:MAG: hypothetical protein O7G85_15865 [Planctomycetota bacterium]|nr:hypothetical protein [Planctomycetota bacterium]